MPSLVEMAIEAMKNFDPKTDPVDSFPEIPDGTYECIIEIIDYRVAQTGSDFIQATCEITEGDYINQKIFVKYFFTEKTQDRSVQSIMTLLNKYGYEVEVADLFADYETIAEGMQVLIGLECYVKVSTTVSKNGKKFTRETITPVMV